MNEPEQIPSACHFTSGRYLHIKTETGQRAFLMNEGEHEVDAALRYGLEIRDKIDHLMRQQEALRQFVNGETVSHPDALRA